MPKVDKTETLVTIGDMTYVREVTKLTCIVVSVYISSLAQFVHFLSLFELVSLLSKVSSHSDKDHKDRTTFLKLDKRRENETKCRKKHNFQVCSTSLIRSC